MSCGERIQAGSRRLSRSSATSTTLLPVSTETELGVPVWVGPRYRAAGLSGVRLAIFADKEPERDSDFARVGRGLDCSITQKYIDGTVPHREFTDVARLVLGRAATRPECEEFWRSVAFANSADPSGGTRRRPVMTEEDWEVTCAAFVDFVDQVEPQALLVFGANLFTGLRSEPSALRQLRRLESRTAVIVHPGTIGFSFREHRAEVQKLGLPQE